MLQKGNILSQKQVIGITWTSLFFFSIGIGITLYLYLYYTSFVFVLILHCICICIGITRFCHLIGWNFAENEYIHMYVREYHKNWEPNKLHADGIMVIEGNVA